MTILENNSELVVSAIPEPVDNQEEVFIFYFTLF